MSNLSAEDVGRLRESYESLSTSADHATFASQIAAAFLVYHQAMPALLQLAEAVNKNEARYLWLRDSAWSSPASGPNKPCVFMTTPKGTPVRFPQESVLDGDALDAAIDDAMNDKRLIPESEPDCPHSALDGCNCYSNGRLVPDGGEV